MPKTLAAKTDGSPGVVYRGIVDGLYRGRYVPGQRLVEADLTRDFEVGRGSVREALSRLAAEGLVSMNLHRSATIRSLSRNETRDLVALLEVLNGFAARLAAERVEEGANRKLIAEAYASLADVEVQRDFLRFARARNTFYKTMVAMGANHELARLMPRTNVDLVRVQFRAYTTVDDDVRIEDYRAIYEAINEGAGRKAETAAKTHIRRLGDAIDKLPDAAFAG
ncbi:MAG: GntR family transcriptional regulator [Methylobacteriaceae bacterium]|nr:GntR family transcriptional regulator [Methylobacteriaceae bacterium]